MDIAIVVVALFVCMTINAIHKRNKKTEIIVEAMKNGVSVNVEG